MSKGKTTFLSISYKVVATVFCLLLYLSYASVLIDPAVLPIAGFFGLYFIPVLLLNILLLPVTLPLTLLAGLFSKKKEDE